MTLPQNCLKEQNPETCCRVESCLVAGCTYSLNKAEYCCTSGGEKASGVCWYDAVVAELQTIPGLVEEGLARMEKHHG